MDSENHNENEFCSHHYLASGREPVREWLGKLSREDCSLIGCSIPRVPLGFTPYRHQRTAFSRLAASAGRSTVIATGTGTGSGKTECFLYPILRPARC